MTREQRQKREKKGSKRNVSLADALSATQQHTVPVLPHFGPTRQEHGETLADTATSSGRNRRPADDVDNTYRMPAEPHLPSNRAAGMEQLQQTRITAAHTLIQAAQPRAPQQPQQSLSPTGDGKTAGGTSTGKTTGRQKAPKSTRTARTTGAQPRLPVTAPDGFIGNEADIAQVTQSLAKAQLVLPDVMADAIPSGKATRLLPALEGGDETAEAATQLVPVREQDRQLALPAEQQSPAVFIRGAKRPPRFNSARVVPRRQGPRPYVIQFIVAMITVMLLFSVLTLSSPLGKSLASLGPLQAYANAIPWVPTPTPTPKPTPTPVYYAPPGANPGAQAIINEIVSVFGGYSQGALNIARCESGYDPNARNPYAVGNSHAEGVFQILFPSTWDTTSYSGYSPYDATANIHAAYQIFSRDGYSWREWACSSA